MKNIFVGLYDKYYQKFVDTEVDVDTLLCCYTNKDLKKIGIKKAAHRDIIFEALDSLDLKILLKDIDLILFYDAFHEGEIGLSTLLGCKSHEALKELNIDGLNAGHRIKILDAIRKWTEDTRL